MEPFVFLFAQEVGKLGRPMTSVRAIIYGSSKNQQSPTYFRLARILDIAFKLNRTHITTWRLSGNVRKPNLHPHPENRHCSKY